MIGSDLRAPEAFALLYRLAPILRSKARSQFIALAARCATCGAASSKARRTVS